jgi:SH3-like domain-containing protein
MTLFLAMALLTANPPGGAVLKPVANMYSAPTEDADVVSQAIYGTNVAVVEEKDGWIKVRTPDEYTGWMAAASLRRGRAYAAGGRVAQVDSLFTNLYRDPDVTKHQPVLTLPFETRLEVVAEPENNQRWIQVRLVDDRLAWIQRGDVLFGPQPLSVEATLDLSKRFLGLPYLWGGTSTFGYDCSGFVQMLCRRRGVLIPRDAQPQAGWSGMTPVERADLRPGDLLYFGRSPTRITHTGMYLGDGLFISATTHERPMVRIDRLEDDYWAKLFVATRRLK